MIRVPQNFRGLSAVYLLVAANVAVFLLQTLLFSVGIEEVFGLSREGLMRGMVWQPVTYQFLHANLFHLLANMLGLWFAGKILEGILGKVRFVAFYLVCGIVGGLLQIALSPGPMLVGASGAVCGVVAAFSAMYPEMPITAVLFFVIPVHLRAKWLGIGILVVSVVLIVTGLGGNIGNAAHLGGALTGCLRLAPPTSENFRRPTLPYRQIESL